MQEHVQATRLTVTVTLNPTPNITPSPIRDTVCSGITFTVTPVDGTNGIVPAGTTYSWNAPSGTGFTGGAAGTDQVNISGTLINTTTSNIIVIYGVTPNAGSCAGSLFLVRVTLEPAPQITNMSTPVCSGTTFTVTPANGTNGIVPPGTTYSWPAPTGTGFTGGAAGSGSGITGTLTNTMNTVQTATYTVTPTAGTCTGNTFTVTVTLNPTPAINNITATVCSGTAFTVTPVNGTNGIVPSGTTYSWPAPSGTGFTGGTAGSESSITGTLTNTTSAVQTAIYTVTPIAGTCTGNTFTVTVTLNPTPNITPSPIRDTICSGITFMVTPVNGTNGIVPAGTTYSWNAPSGTGFTGGAAGTDQVNISGTLINTTTSNIIVIYGVTPNAGSCIGNLFLVRVTLEPSPQITNISIPVCSGTTFTVTPANGTNGIVPPGTTYSWPAPTGTGFTGGAAGSGSGITGTLTNTTNTVQTATYTVTPNAGTCAGNAFTVTVTLNPTPAINNITATVCSGTAFTVTPVNGTNGIVPSGTTYSWPAPTGSGFTGGAAGSGSSITGTLTNTTSAVQTATYTVTPIAGTCTGNTFTVIITLNPIPAINNMTATVCSGTAFTVTPVNGTNGIVPSGTTYSWPAPSGTGFTGGAAGSGTQYLGNLDQYDEHGTDRHLYSDPDCGNMCRQYLYRHGDAESYAFQLPIHHCHRPSAQEQAPHWSPLLLTSAEPPLHGLPQPQQVYQVSRQAAPAPFLFRQLPLQDQHRELSLMPLLPQLLVVWGQ